MKLKSTPRALALHLSVVFFLTAASLAANDLIVDAFRNEVPEIKLEGVTYVAPTDSADSTKGFYILEGHLDPHYTALFSEDEPVPLQPDGGFTLKLPAIDPEIVLELGMEDSNGDRKRAQLAFHVKTAPQVTKVEETPLPAASSSSISVQWHGEFALGAETSSSNEKLNGSNTKTSWLWGAPMARGAVSMKLGERGDRSSWIFRLGAQTSYLMPLASLSFPPDGNIELKFGKEISLGEEFLLVPVLAARFERVVTATPDAGSSQASQVPLVARQTDIIWALGGACLSQPQATYPWIVCATGGFSPVSSSSADLGSDSLAGLTGPRGAASVRLYTAGDHRFFMEATFAIWRLNNANGDGLNRSEGDLAIGIGF